MDRLLVARAASYRDIARQYSVSKDAVSRHVKEHLPELLAKAHEAEEAARAGELLDEARDLQARTLAILEAAERTRQHRTALSAIREARGNLELLAKLLGELDQRPQINLTLSAEWVRIRAVVLEALGPYSEARSAVAGRLLEVEAS